MLYLWTRLRLAAWCVRSRPSPAELSILKWSGDLPEFLKSPKDDRFTHEVKAEAFDDFLKRVIA